MQRISDRYKQIPPTTDLKSFKWFIVFVGTVRNISGVRHVCESLKLPTFKVWAPVYQEHCRTQTDIVLTDRLIYPGYIFLGVLDEECAAQVSAELREQSKGFILGGNYAYLTTEEIKHILEAATKLAETPKIMFDVKAGDSVIISSGPLSGFRATVEKVYVEGKVKLRAFFMSRELSVEMSVLDVQSLGESINDLG